MLAVIVVARLAFRAKNRQLLGVCLLPWIVYVA